MLSIVFGARAVSEASEFINLKNTWDLEVGLETGDF
jgi:hypothetical protein